VDTRGPGLRARREPLEQGSGQCLVNCAFAYATCSPFAHPVTQVTESRYQDLRRHAAGALELAPEGPPEVA